MSDWSVNKKLIAPEKLEEKVVTKLVAYQIIVLKYTRQPRQQIRQLYA